jgi:hypothetical protein
VEVEQVLDLVLPRSVSVVMLDPSSLGRAKVGMLYDLVYYSPDLSVDLGRQGIVIGQ